MNNVVDRVPTKVLDNGAVRWEQFDENGVSLGFVYLRRADEPIEIGTPLNKVLFDSIQTDLDSRLKTSSKATQAQAEAGTDNTNYMTALRVMQALKKNSISVKTGTVSSGVAIPKTDGFANYVYFAGINDVYSYDDTASGVVTIGIRLNCSVDQTTRIVTITERAYTSPTIENWNGKNGTVKNGTANYIEIAWN